MNKNNPINSVYLIALAYASLIMFVNHTIEAFVFAVTVVSVFLFAISVVSMIEKIADKHVKYIAFALICSALITILKIVFQYVNVSLIVIMSKTIDIAIIPCLLIGIVPIYFEDSFSVKQYFISSLVMAFGVLLMFTLSGFVVDILGRGFYLGENFNFDGLEFFLMPYGKLIIIALVTVLFNIVRRTYLIKTRRYRMLVEKYKIQVREIRSSNQRKKELEGENVNEWVFFNFCNSGFFFKYCCC